MSKKSKISLRPYQKEAHKNISKKLKPGKKTLLCLPTGTGKTFTAASWIVSKKRKTLWLAHRNELVTQAYNTFKNLGAKTSIWNANKKDSSGEIIVASILSTGEINNEIEEVDTIVVDEAHHFPMGSYSGDNGIINRVKHKRILGLTATPTRLDGKDLGFDSIAYQRTFFEMVNEGWLAKPEYHIIRTGLKIDLKKVGGRFTKESLHKVNNEARNKSICEAMESIGNLGKTLIFAVDIEHAKSLTKSLKKFKPVFLTGNSTTKERNKITSDFYSGKIKLLINCMIYVEGIDVPDINTVVLARPTASKVLYMQTLGRGARITENKDSFKILDVVDADKHYSVMSERWSMEELGHNIDIKEATKSDKKAREYIEEEDTDYDKLLKKYDTSSMQVVGIIKFSSFKEKYIIPLTYPKMEAILQWQNFLYDSYNKVDNENMFYYYTLYASPAGFSLSDWKKVARAVNATIKGFERNNPAEMTAFRELPTLGVAKESTNIILEELDRINNIMKIKFNEFINSVIYEIKSMVSKKVYSVISSAKYKYMNGVIEVNLGVPFHNLKSFLPARLLLQEIANEKLDTEIIDISYSVWSRS